MNTDSNTTREIVSRFHNAFEKHRPEDLDDLIGEECVLKIRLPRRMARATKGAGPASISGKGSHPQLTLSLKPKKSGPARIAGSSAGSFVGARARRTGSGG